jgi:hypothetical protein
MGGDLFSFPPDPDLNLGLHSLPSYECGLMFHPEQDPLPSAKDLAGMKPYIQFFVSLDNVVLRHRDNFMFNLMYRN